MKKIFRFLCGLILLMLLCGTVVALEINDNQDDVEHYIKEPSSREYVSSKPNLDVTKVFYDVDGGVVTLSLTVKGVIEDDNSITYYAEYESSDELYQFTYTNGNLNSQASEMVNGEKNLIGQATGGPTIDPANTIKATFNVVASGGSDGKLYGYAGEDFPGIGVNEYWVDNTEEIDNGPGDGTGDGTSNEDEGTSPTPSTPGFELITIIAACGITFILLRRKQYL